MKRQKYSEISETGHKGTIEFQLSYVKKAYSNSNKRIQ